MPKAKLTDDEKEKLFLTWKESEEYKFIDKF